MATADRVVDGDGVVQEQFFVAAAVRRQIVDVDFSVGAPTAVDVRGPVALVALVVARQTETLLGHRDVEQAQVAGRMNGGTVVDAIADRAVLSIRRPVLFTNVALGTVSRTFLALAIAASTDFQLRTANIITSKQLASF